MFLLAVCFIDLDLCLRLFSCWKMKLLFIVLMETCRFYAKMFWYLALPMIASILTTAPVPAEENKTIKQLKSSVWSDHKIFRHMILAKFRLAKGFFFWWAIASVCPPYTTDMWRIQDVVVICSKWPLLSRHSGNSFNVMLCLFVALFVFILFFH